MTSLPSNSSIAVETSLSRSYSDRVFSVTVPAKTARKLGKFSILPWHGVLGLALIVVAWPVSWLHISTFSQHSFFPLWLGYILAVDAIVLRRTGTSSLTRSPRAFAAMFLISMPMWWVFEGINYFTHNWHYLGAENYSPIRYFLVASWHFSIVAPAVFETAELIASTDLAQRFKRGPQLPRHHWVLIVSMAIGIVMLPALIVWPHFAFPATWLSIFLILDPINYYRGWPSIVGRIGNGDWRSVVAFGVGALICGLFWEMWNYWAFPKWYYTIPFGEYAHVFEMPLLGYGGYIPFGLEVFAMYHFLSGFLGPRRSVLVMDQRSEEQGSISRRIETKTEIAM